MLTNLVILATVITFAVAIPLGILIAAMVCIADRKE